MNKYFLILISLISFNLSSQEIDQKYKSAYFGSGCFWCVESIYENLKGVKEVISGYSGGKTVNPSYKEVISGKTGHAEVVKVIYDPNIVSFKVLVDVFFGSHDPSTLNRQGPDRGTQYRSIAFYENLVEKKIIENSIKTLLDNKTFFKVTTEVKKFNKFLRSRRLSSRLQKEKSLQPIHYESFCPKNK